MPFLPTRKKAVVAGALSTVCLLLIVLYATSSNGPSSDMLLYGIMHEPQAASQMNTAPQTDPAITEHLSTHNTSFFHSGLLKDATDKLSVSYDEMRRITGDLREFLVASVRLALAAKKEKTSAAVLSKAREFLRILELKIDSTRALSGTKQNVEATLKSLQGLVQATIYSLQNPSNCSKVPKLMCTLDNPWGFAAGMHDVLWCFIAGLQMGRTVILNSTVWHHAPGDDWSKTFQPVACTACMNVSQANAVTGYPGYDSSFRSRANILNLPSAIAKQLVACHGEPYAWWYGQVMGYILRLQDPVRARIEDFKRERGFHHPIVGIHIRRTDKSREASYHPVEQYMSHVEEFYMKLSLAGAVVKKRAFIATDEPGVIAELHTKFPDYTFVFDMPSAEEAGNRETRTRNTALFNIVRDINLLAESDFMVCTFSSGFCRVAYELMHSLHGDASARAVSIDIDYFYAYVPFPPRRVLYRNQARLYSELDLEKGQVVQRAENAITEAMSQKPLGGYQQGNLVSPRRAGVYPKYKTAQTYRVVHYPVFDSEKVKSEQGY